MRTTNDAIRGGPLAAVAGGSRADSDGDTSRRQAPSRLPKTRRHAGDTEDGRRSCGPAVVLLQGHVW